ncbi:MAG: sensor histidine kinase [Gammaproteobacteria bacterium]|nr:MAG: sensor histidine kinase [Gammaproteobacteria bacterium]
MRTGNLPGWSPQRLRLTMLAFFVALAIPAAFLIFQAYSQLKWETFYQHRQMAEELVKRIDNKITELIEQENSRSFTEFTFLNISGDAQSGFLQRSPLAQFPVTSTMPGILGYFQVDHQGHFTTPLLPNPIPRESPDLVRYGLSNAELAGRQQISRKIYHLLANNDLAATQSPEKSMLGSSGEGSIPESSIPEGSIREDSTPEVSTASKSTTPALESPAPASRIFKRRQKKDRSKLDSLTLMDSVEEQEDYVVLPETDPGSESETEQKLAQSGFDRLQKVKKKLDGDSVEQRSITAGSKQQLGRVEDLKLERTYRARLSGTLTEKKTASDDAGRADGKSQGLLRKEQNILPRQLAARPSLTQEADAPADEKVSIFESEIDGYQFGILDSGQLILYRNVWPGRQHYIQGLIIEPQPFIDVLIAEAFRQTGLANTSDLTAAYRGNVLTVISGTNPQPYLTRASELSGALLLQQRLSSPLDDIELIFSVNTLPAGPGASVINWLSLILLLVLTGGLFLMYRLGLGQIRLARQQQDFVSAVSHELKTPLTSIRMYGEMLREGWAPEEKKREYYDYIHDESDRLTRLINNVLQLANLTRNELQVELAAHSASQLLDTVNSKISSQIERSGFELNIDTDVGAAEKTLMVDTDCFCQIVINLIDNAIKFSKNADHKRIDIRCTTQSGDKVQFSVRDYGPGIAQDQMRRIFQLFYRSENELTRETAGTGIGLALVHELVQAMHGELDVVNASPGAEFRIVFPVAP